MELPAGCRRKVKGANHQMKYPKNYDKYLGRSLKSFPYEIGAAFDLFKFRATKDIEWPVIDIYRDLRRRNKMFTYQTLALDLNALIYFETGEWTYPLPYFHDVNPGDILYNDYSKEEYICILGAHWGTSIHGVFLKDNKLESFPLYNYTNNWSIKIKTDHPTRGPIDYMYDETVNL